MAKDHGKKYNEALKKVDRIASTRRRMRYR